MIRHYKMMYRSPRCPVQLVNPMAHQKMVSLFVDLLLQRSFSLELDGILGNEGPKSLSCNIVPQRSNFSKDSCVCEDTFSGKKKWNQYPRMSSVNI